MNKLILISFVVLVAVCFVQAFPQSPRVEENPVVPAAEADDDLETAQQFYGHRGGYYGGGHRGGYYGGGHRGGYYGHGHRGGYYGGGHWGGHRGGHWGGHRGGYYYG